MWRLNVQHSVDDVPVSEWAELTQDADLDFSRGFLQFREYLEPGESVLLAVRSAAQLRGALRGVMTVPESGLTSDPWKFVSTEAVLRLQAGEDEAEATRLRRAQRDLVRAAAGRDADRDAPPWQLLAKEVGPCFVVREFDRSELICHPETDRAETERLTAYLIRSAQTMAADRGAGAVAFPYVNPGDDLLRGALAEAGFRGGALTGASWIDVHGCSSYDDFLTRLPSRRRRRYRLEEQKLVQAAGFKTGEVNLTDNAERVAVLEAQTLGKYGSQVDPEEIRQTRLELARRLPDAVRISAVERDGQMIACAMHLQGPKSVLCLSYGCDYGIQDRSMSYSWALFYHPIQLAIAGGADQVRLGLEGFDAKARRGAVVEARELWVWTPQEATLGRLGDLLDLVGARNTEYLAQFSPRKVA